MSEIVNAKLNRYAEEHTTSPPELLQELEKDTHERIEGAQMLTGTVEGRFLKLLVQLVGAKRVLEIGMFTGYGTLSMAEGLPEGGEILTCEVRPERIRSARKYFDRSPHGKKIRILDGPALESVGRMAPPFDLVFIDADKTEYPRYYEEALRLLRSGGVIAVDNALWGGSVLDPADEEARAIDELNRKMSKDPRVEAVMLTIRDGLQLARKR